LYYSFRGCSSNFYSLTVQFGVDNDKRTREKKEEEKMIKTAAPKEIFKFKIDQVAYVITRLEKNQNDISQMTKQGDQNKKLFQQIIREMSRDAASLNAILAELDAEFE